MDRLVVICEGGAHSVEYLHKNGVYPGAVVFAANKYREIVPYLTEQDEVLVLIKGLTDFSMQEIYALLKDIEETPTKLKRVTVMSNLHLGNIPAPYYLYSGDLFYGEVKRVENNRIRDITEADYEDDAQDGVLEDTAKKNKKLKRSDPKTAEKKSINAVAWRYKKYNKRDVKVTIYGSNTKEVEPTEGLDDLVDKLIVVDLFKNTNVKDGEV